MEVVFLAVPKITAQPTENIHDKHKLLNFTIFMIIINFGKSDFMIIMN